jgi:hypothetical protein
MEDDWIYESEDFDEDIPYVELQFGIDDIHLIYKSLQVHIEKWPGGHPAEQERLDYLKTFFARIVLEYKYQSK